jgi:uncharacterized protein (DUF885 family)
VRRLVAVISLASACHPASRTTLPDALVRQASAGVKDPRLADLLVRDWDETMRQYPTWATTLGDHRFDDRLDDNSEAAVARTLALTKGFLAEATTLHGETMSDADAETRDLFIASLEDAIAVEEACGFERWSIGVQSRNPVSPWDDFDTLPMKTSADAAHYLARVRAIPKWIDNDLALIESGAAQGKFANAESVKRVLAMIDRQLGAATADWPMAAPLKTSTDGAFKTALTDAIDKGVRPAMERWRDAVKAQVLPHAREGAQAGVGALPGGMACYAALIHSHTSLPLTSDELHARGLADVEKSDAAIKELGKKLFGTDDLAQIFAKLRTDPSLRFADADEIEAKAKKALAASKAKIPQFFGVLPKADCIVKRIPDASAPFTMMAYYEQAHADGSEPGHFMINVFQPTTRSKVEMEVLAFHESIPGHHLQISIAEELPAEPAFRKYEGTTAFVEGWGLYSERLADEMGLYDGDLDRMGMLSFDAWRASRLVVDTGLHAMGWTREQAIDFLKAHTALAEDNIANEVDRYLVDPGQALAYKVGQEEIFALRQKAMDALGPKFDLSAFHDAVLGGGAVTLPVLEKRIDRWINGRR